MRKDSIMQCSLLRFCVPFFILAISFSYAPFVLAATTTEISGNEVNTNGKVVNEELAKPSLDGHEEEEKFKGLTPTIKPGIESEEFLKPKPFIKKPIPKLPLGPKFEFPINKPIIMPKPKPFVLKKPIPGIESEEFLKPKFLFKKPIPKLPLDPKFEFPVNKPNPIIMPKPKPFVMKKPITGVGSEEFLKPKPFFEKPIPKPFEPKFEFPINKPIPIIKPKPKPFIAKKPIPSVESEEFLKPKGFFKKSIPKLPLYPKFRLPNHKPIIPTP